AALNGGWAENYGKNAQRDGDNIPLNLGSSTNVKFYYDHKTNWVTDNVNSRIATAPGSYQSEIGCSSDWSPDCLRSWLQDPDGDGVYSFSTDAIPPGNYEFKVAINEGWSENYGAGGTPGGDNISFSVAGAGTVTFSFNSATNTPSVSFRSNLPGPDNNVEWDGLRHDSRDTLYRTPGGAVATGTPITIRFRTLHNDVTSVRLRVYDVNANGQRFIPMERVASDTECFQTGLRASCDYWAATLSYSSPNNFWYRFIVQDGTATTYYDDNTAALDGGLGQPYAQSPDRSYALMVYDPAFRAPEWAQSAVVYQIFPDRFRNGDPRNDPRTGDSRYDDPMIALPWNVLPEGYCRNYADADTNCPWRFDDTPPAWSPTKEGPRGRDYMGGDLRGVIQQLDYLQRMGVTAIYFNPIFHAKSNHRYDTYDYMKVDPALGTLGDWRRLVREADRRGIRVILDSVFNHMSSDSPQFDRYGFYDTVGACESANSLYRGWFNFRTPAGNEPSPCVPSTPGGTDTYYAGWFGFDSIPEIKKTVPAVQEYFLTAPNSVSRYWLKQHLRGETADSTMNYRLRDAIIGLLTPGAFDSKGFGDSGRQIAPSEFGSRVQSIREDYPDAAYYSLMNLVGSHDTERILWTLTPGRETRAEKEFDAANLNDGKRRLQIAAMIQFTMPGMPTVYYGDEVGVTGDDDPDDRRTYPWRDKGGNPDQQLLRFYSDMAKHRNHYQALVQGDLRMLLADDAAGTVAYGRTLGDEAAVVLINRSNATRTISVPMAGFAPNDTRFQAAYCVANEKIDLWHQVKDGMLTLTLEPMSAALLTSYQADLTAPAAPGGLKVTDEGNGQVSLAWNGVAGAAGYNLYRSPVTGGGYVKVNNTPLTGTSFTDTGLRNARNYFYVVKALDSRGNESTASAEIVAMPHLKIGWANLQWPPTLSHTISAINRTGEVYGQVWIDGATSQPGPAETLQAQLGFGPAGSNPAGNSAWTWVDASFNVNAGNNDEFKASLLPEVIGSFDYVYRYSTTNGRDWLYADLNGPVASGATPANPGKLTVNPSADTVAPTVPGNLRTTSASPAGIVLAWDASSDNAQLYGYEVLRSDTAGGPFSKIATVTGATGYTDTAVAQGASYSYVVRAVDESFNRSANSNEIRATAELRTVTLTFNVTVPAGTAATGRSVYIAGSLQRLDGNLPEWNPGGVVLTRVNDTLWRITLTGKEGVQIEYKYTLGAWDFVEKGDACDEIANRQLTLAYGSNGQQAVNDMVLNWRNVAPCGN
ncbi:MAG: alpha-amylase family glycosyl hydrolase, partial [Chloroflexaceae bacterium]|nr:alpha-amylase family glycosyl hydrolase [Chloroflexaceae bacterium]